MGKNLGFKVFSVLLALILWLQVMLSAEHKTIMRFKVVMKDLPSKVVVRDAPKDIPFYIQGKGQDLLAALIRGVRVEFDASGIEVDQTYLPMENYEIIGLPPNAEFKILEPVTDAHLTLKADSYNQKSVEVIAAFENDQARAEFYARGYIMKPERITINGARNFIANVSHLKTEPIKANMLKQESFEVKISFPNKQINSGTTMVGFTRKPIRSETRIFTALPVVSPLPDISPRTVTLKVTGDPELIKTLSPSSFTISTQGDPDENGWINLEAKCPPGITDYELTPKRVLHN
ncbi:MAG: hypothetical protein GX122_04865 [Candidatus Cloacimonetes bacterium]|nr:hypothetical protein [Candidatus Cloacimonadota bacterium]